MIIENNFEELNLADNNECTLISFNIDFVSNSDFYSFYQLCLKKLRMNGKLCLSGTSLTMFAKSVIHSKKEVKVLQKLIEDSKCFHDLIHVEGLIRRDLFVENIWYEDERFYIVGLRND